MMRSLMTLLVLAVVCCHNDHEYFSHKKTDEEFFALKTESIPIIGALEDYKHRNGVYPSSLDFIGTTSPPSIGAGYWVYRPYMKNEEYVLLVPVKGTDIEYPAYIYSSSQLEWKYDG